MPSKKKKYNSRFPPGRIKKIMQTDEEVGKVAQAVPVIISRALELFIESLLTKAVEITSARNAKTLTQSHMKQCILSESRFDFLKEFVRTVPDLVGDSDELPTPSGSSVGGMGSSMDEPNLMDPTLPLPVEAHQNGLQIKQETSSDSDCQEAPLNLVTGATVLPVPPLHYFSTEDAAKSKVCLVNSDTTSAVTNLDEDYDL